MASSPDDAWYTLRCCNDQQLQNIYLIVGYTVLIFKLWRFPLIHPFKILTVFLHEMGHASAVWLTCGKVTGMEVHPNEGGVTKYVGGIAFIIVPAGYLGSAVWGMALVIASPNKLAAEIAAGVLIALLFVFIFYAQNAYLRYLNAGFIVLLGGLLALTLATEYNGVRYLVLLVGVMSCLFSIYDIWDDLIARRVNDSDASVFAKMTHTSSRCWGVIWGLFALATMGCALYFNLVVAMHSYASTPTIHAASEMTSGTLAALVLAASVVVLGVVHTVLTRRCMVRTGSHQAGYGAAP
ncbi:hypothetical protein SDRG_09939 [Saprolegnia diclina VS20]|uniref:Uncharacterized protein n=1 Tax=Saprolegnia diclina (strain VS20) TaxID=1156394 RepID=T0QD24_SAPDV|nr:hypothetical protein SDRG_09939 [Saprolegnia diclina VS20]EQC32626.1 hypothetical protein SDRG_09939 [Saprolegnia diclina VS20]|eukprot:XP_008614127.1 hypothetical protein SDRG_09939 [Saprolegnia diclina VS20]